MELPSHVPLTIDVNDISEFEQYLSNNGYTWTLFQIQKPGQLFGMVKEVEYDGILVDHHIRCHVDGTITTEIELRRLKDLWLHLTSHSISAHERVISILNTLDIQFDIDEKLRKQYALRGPTEFRRDYLEFFRWLFIGVIFWTPIGYLWKIKQKVLN